MNRMLPALYAIVIFGLGMVTPAGADPITFADSFDPSDVLFDSSAASCTGTHGLPDTVSGQVSGKCGTLSFAYQLPGFDSLLHSVNSAILTLFFYDDNEGPGGSDNNGQPERFDLSVNTTLFDDAQVITELSSLGSQFSEAYDVKAVVQPDGSFNIVLVRDSNGGDFKFASSTLSAEWERKVSTEPQDPPRDVPEPASLVLLGVGLLGVARQAKRA